MTRRRSAWFVLGIAIALGSAERALAQPVDEGSLAAARALGREGLDALDKKDFATALDRLQRAYQVVKAPSLAPWSARALEKNGKLVEAAERYLEATRLEATSGDLATQKQARIDAASEREALLPRIPQLTLHAPSSDVEVAIDGVGP
jgi:Tfp pilus assembly protein PilF